MTADLALIANDPTVLDVYDDPGQQIILACQRVVAELKATSTDVEAIVEVKAQAAALAAFVAKRQLGADAELAALEVQRRAERGIGLAIRKGQEAGEINRAGGSHSVDTAEWTSPYDFASHSELYGDGRSRVGGIYQMADAVTDEQFDAAIEAAKAERRLSRANVVRKVRAITGSAPTTTDDGAQKQKPLRGAKDNPARLDRIRELAASGNSSDQIANEVGVLAAYVRMLAREHDIGIPADLILRKTRYIDSTRVAREAVFALDGLATTLALINYDDIDPADAREWATSLSESIRPLNRFIKQIKEIAQ